MESDTKYCVEGAKKNQGPSAEAAAEAKDSFDLHAFIGLESLLPTNSRHAAQRHLRGFFSLSVCLPLLFSLSLLLFD